MYQQQNTGSLYADKPSVNAKPRPEIGLVTNRDPETVYCDYVNFKGYLTALSVAETIKRQWRINEYGTLSERYWQGKLKYSERNVYNF